MENGMNVQLQWIIIEGRYQDAMGEILLGSVQYLTTKSKQPIKEYKSTLYVVMYQSSPVIVDSHYTI